MPLNTYFSGKVKTEQFLYEDLIIEAMKIYGVDVYYIPRRIVREDFIFNEDLLSEFGESYVLETYIESVDGYEGEGAFLSKFGMEIRNQVNLIISRRRWEQLVGRFTKDNNGIRPQEGDLIYMPMVKGLFEIRFVDGDTPFHQLQNMPTYKVTCELFEYGNEKIDTGIPEIDSFETIFGTQVDLTLGAGAGYYIIGETVTQEIQSSPLISISAEVSNNEIDGQISVVNISSSDGNNTSFEMNGAAVIGSESDASWTLSTLSDIPRDNLQIELESQSFIDFSEFNPFSEPNEIL